MRSINLLTADCSRRDKDLRVRLYYRAQHVRVPLPCLSVSHCRSPPPVVYNAIPSKHETLNRPPSLTLAQHQHNIRSTSRVCCADYTHNHTRLYNTIAKWRVDTGPRRHPPQCGMVTSDLSCLVSSVWRDSGAWTFEIQSIMGNVIVWYIFNIVIFKIWRRVSMISMQGFQCFYNYKDHCIYPCADIRTV